MTAVRSYRDPEVRRSGMRLAVAVHGLTATLPQSERYGLISQLQRSAVSIPSNIAEGHERDWTKRFLRFPSIAQGPLAELETQLPIAAELRLADRTEVDPLSGTAAELGRMLNGLQSKLRQRLTAAPLASGL